MTLEKIINHKLTGGVVLAGALFALCSSAPAAAELTVDYDLAFASAYVWRGYTFTDGAVFQPSVNIGHDSGFNFNVWGNLDIDDYNGLSGEFQEVDLTLSYGWGGDNVSAEVGYIEYLFPNLVGLGTREVYFNVGFDVALSPSITVYYDFDEIEGYYANFAISHGGDLGGGDWSYSIDLSAGYSSSEFSGADSGFSDGNISFTLSKGGFSAYVAYTDQIDKDVIGDQPVDFYGGVGYTISF